MGSATSRALADFQKHPHPPMPASPVASQLLITPKTQEGGEEIPHFLKQGKGGKNPQSNFERMEEKNSFFMLGHCCKHMSASLKAAFAPPIGAFHGGRARPGDLLLLQPRHPGCPPPKKSARKAALMPFQPPRPSPNPDRIVGH